MNHWPQILWRESRTCDDRDYARYLRRTLWAAPWNWLSGFSFRRGDRPQVLEIEAALQAACAAQRAIRYLWEPRLARLAEARQKQTPISKLIDDLQANHWFERFLARHLLFDRGGEAVLPLITPSLTGLPQTQAVGLWLLQSISTETRQRLTGEATRLFCIECVVHCHQHEVEVGPAGRLDYYGCRLCHQSREFRAWPGGVVALLDRGSRQEKVEAGDQIRVNWLARRQLFDFDRVEIVQASDEEVERFAVQVGNDTDPNRRSLYKKMPWTVALTCRLSENSLRILEFTFGPRKIP